MGHSVCSPLQGGSLISTLGLDTHQRLRVGAQVCALVWEHSDSA